MIKRLLKVLGIIVALVICTYLGTKIMIFIHYLCPFKTLFNITCAGCGTTRMLKLIFEFKFGEAFRYNQLMLILVIFFGLYGIVNAITYVLKGKVIKLPIKFYIAVIIILVIYMIMRNIPSFDFLRPPEGVIL